MYIPEKSKELFVSQLPAILAILQSKCYGDEQTQNALAWCWLYWVESYTGYKVVETARNAATMALAKRQVEFSGQSSTDALDHVQSSYVPDSDPRGEDCERIPFAMSWIPLKLQVFGRLLSQGLSCEQIGKRLGVSKDTVERRRNELESWILARQ